MDPDALFNEGLRRARMGDHAAALVFLQQAAALERDRADTYRLMGKVHLHLGQIAQAEWCWRQALALEPEDAASAAYLAQLRRFSLGRETAGTLAALAVLALLTGFGWHQWDSLRALRASLASLETTSLHLAQRIESLEATPSSSVATAPPLEWRPDPVPPASIEESYREALSAALQGRIGEARRLFESIAASINERDPLSANAHFWLGRCLFELGETQAALQQFTFVTDRYPDHRKSGDALLDIGRCYSRLGRHEKALLAWQRLLDGPFAPELREAARQRLGRVKGAESSKRSCLKPPMNTDRR